MNAMKRAHEIRKEAAAKWNCKTSEIIFEICLEMAWAEIKNAKKNVIVNISEKKVYGQIFPLLTVKCADGKTIETVGKSNLEYKVGEVVKIAEISGIGFQKTTVIRKIAQEEIMYRVINTAENYGRDEWYTNESDREFETREQAEQMADFLNTEYETDCFSVEEI